MKFINFDINLEPKTGEGYPVLADSAKYGQARTVCKLDMSSDEIKQKLEAISKESLDGDGLTAFGKLLGDSVFSGPVEDKLNQIVGGVKSLEKTGVRIRLRVNAPELNSLPWEFMQLGDDPIATSTYTILTRYIEMEDIVNAVEAPMPLRMLGIIPEGSGLDTEKEKAAMDKALGELGKSLELTWLEGKVTKDLIRDKLGEAEFHIVHFIGHGFMDGTKASLRLVDEYGDEYPIAAETFAGFFRDSTVRLVVLNACRGAARSASDAALGVAPQTVKRGVPAVVAMQWDINDRVAQSFAKKFYRTLCIGPEAGEVDTAVTRARATLYDDWPGTRAFATPVLFLRAEDGRLWKGIEEEEDGKGRSETPQTITNVMGHQFSGTASGDVTFGNKITTGDNSPVIMAEQGANVNIGGSSAGGAVGVAALMTQVTLWQSAINSQIDKLSLSDDEKKDVKDQVIKIKTELIKNRNLDPGRATKLINSLGSMGSNDLIEFTVKRLSAPLQAVGFSLSLNTDFQVKISSL